MIFFERRYVVLGVFCLNKFDAATKGTKQFSNAQVLSSALAAFGKLEAWAFRLLNRIVTLVLASNYYIFEERNTCQLLRHSSNIQ